MTFYNVCITRRLQTFKSFSVFEFNLFIIKLLVVLYILFLNCSRGRDTSQNACKNKNGRFGKILMTILKGQIKFVNLWKFCQ